MENDKFDILKSNVQEIIDMIASNNAIEANNKLVDVSEQLDDLLDHSEADEELIEISRYQVLLNKLHEKILALDGQV
jgi:predicted ATP-grasp superfamily ATP-dependent carboligase